MLLPDTMTIRVVIPFSSRHSAYCSFDGRNRVELKRKIRLPNTVLCGSHSENCSLEGDHIKVSASPYPVPTICYEDASKDWIASLQECLHWNVRQRQKSFVMVESEEKDAIAAETPVDENKTFAVIDEGKASPTSRKMTPDLSETSSTTMSDDEDETAAAANGLSVPPSAEEYDLQPWTEDELQR